MTPRPATVSGPTTLLPWLSSARSAPPVTAVKSTSITRGRRPGGAFDVPSVSRAGGGGLTAGVVATAEGGAGVVGGVVSARKGQQQPSPLHANSDESEADDISDDDVTLTTASPLRPRRGNNQTAVRVAVPDHHFDQDLQAPGADAVLWLTVRSWTHPQHTGTWKAFTRSGTLYIEAAGFAQLSDAEFRDVLLALLELCEDVLYCQAVAMCIDRSEPTSADLVRAFMYAGFELVNPTVYQHNPAYILMGYEL
ncbi:ornithine decarboxylase antizyme-domain-containing protein [Dimargaris cristalligena]|uniref:Ornithine decarboxylase antizyme n=1 Tax=Dimargaris cristalligena TaxID=215637 RepID=A0A4Q0A1W5_9FUNG|nr:ornithine decarboxylase antizyme-domain-containing protein [Dimargaris cristalligena]|eukprot:RKP40083.1 ornithine decarboxylase antizyme-domain-containing protein [Dimargaris cristalligena]